MTGRREALASFYRGRRVLVTGHTGFKGAWLALALSELGADVTGIALAPPDDGVYRLAGIGDRVRHHEVDIRSTAEVAAIVEDAAPEIVLHLAAQALVPDSFRDPVTTFDVNVVGTASVLAACSAGSIRSVVVVTSDKVYANDGSGRAFVEGDRLGGGDPYSASKGATELVVASWRHSFLTRPGAGVDYRLATARAGNVIGGGDRARDRVVPDVVEAIGANRSVQLRNPAAVRPWQFVLEPVVGYLELAAQLAAPGRADDPALHALNFGPDPASSSTVSELVDRMIAEWGQGSWTSVEDRPGPEASVLLLDSSAAARSLGWRSYLDLDEVVRLTVDWYRCAADRGDCAGLSVAQLRDYLAAMDDHQPHGADA